MKERGIIFNGEMVRATLEGRKTQTRRTYGLEKINQNPDDWELIGTDGELWRFQHKVRGESCYGKCPYGVPGDLLWVRETYCELDDPMTAFINGKMRLLFREELDAAGKGLPKGLKWRPSIFMPHWASRITLEITEVRVERLQEISDGDCQAEGCQYPQWHGSHTSWKGAYKALWDSLNAKRGYPWESNPWVWVISFKRQEK